MAFIDKFLGQRVEIPDDLRYSPKQGLWGRLKDDVIVFGMTRPALVLMGGVKDFEPLVSPGQKVRAGESILFAITGKILYLDAPLPGLIDFNRSAQANPDQINSDPYGQGWLFNITLEEKAREAYETMVGADQYLQSLRGSEGFKNPDGIKGGVSGICKAVYTGIGGQKIQK